jgi:hypothetical protein
VSVASVECCLYEGPITRPEESNRLRCVIMCDLEISTARRSWRAMRCAARRGMGTNCAGGWTGQHKSHRSYICIYA